MNAPFDLDAWIPFLAAEAGAAATLAGLLFVGVSLNLSKVLSQPFLPLRGLLALFLLVAILVAASLLLIPGQTFRSAGTQLLLVGGTIWTAGSLIELNGWRRANPSQNRVTFLVNVALQQAASFPYLVAGILVLSGDPGGLSWFAIAVVFSFLKAVVDSWVLLVEINR
jgi:hypothetical protein